MTDITSTSLRTYIDQTIRCFSHVTDQNSQIINFVRKKFLYAVDKKLTVSFIKKCGFALVKKECHENIKMPYYAKDAVLLFYNESAPKGPFLAGFGFIHNHKYMASTFRWIHTRNELINLYSSLTGKSLLC